MAVAAVSTGDPGGPTLDDVQGLVRSSYSTLPQARYLAYTLGDGAGGNGFLTALLPSVTTAAERAATTVVQVALAASGLSALGLDAGALGGFSLEYTAGMATPARSHFLGDVAESAPASWAWGGPATARVDLLVLCLADSVEALDGVVDSVAGLADSHGATLAATLTTRTFEVDEPFGFRDGISQPLVTGLTSRAAAGTERAVPLGEFVLGYRNAYGNLTERPLLAPADDPGHLLPVDPTSGQPDLGRNGTYLVARSLRQDVAAFTAYTASAAESEGVSADHVAARLVGRWPSGAPLVLAPDADRPDLATANGFGYRAEDPLGYRCPPGAHIRRANPRDHLDGRAQDVGVTNRHRLLRRGREYGPRDNSAPVGLHFLALNANLSRQFEFIQHSWLNNPKFDGLYDDVDPIAGARSSEACRFTVPARPVRHRYPQPPPFVTTEGGGYFFLPGIRALRYLAGLRPATAR